jgi:hypothetical protein
MDPKPITPTLLPFFFATFFAIFFAILSSDDGFAQAAVYNAGPAAIRGRHEIGMMILCGCYFTRHESDEQQTPSYRARVSAAITDCTRELLKWQRERGEKGLPVPEADTISSAITPT